MDFSNKGKLVSVLNKDLFKRIIFIALIIIISSSSKSFSQDSLKSGPIPLNQQFDVNDWFRKIFKKKPAVADTLIASRQKLNLSILPGISYNPATSVSFGIASSLSWFYGNPKTTTNSSVYIGVTYTLKNQLKISALSNIFTRDNKYILAGEFRFWKYIQNTYGLGTGSPDTAQNMKFNFFKVSEIVSRKVMKYTYLGLGYNLEYYSKIETLNDNDSAVSPNFNNSYSRLHGIDSTSYLASGIMVNLIIDSRDNTTNSYKGVYGAIQYRTMNKFLGSTSNYQDLVIQFKNYQSFNKHDTYILASWFMSVTALNGTVPYMILPANGWDKYNASGRGYIQGRFRGRDWLYLEFENRITLTRNRFLGMVIFANAMSSSDPDNSVKLLQYIKPAYGVGLRILFDKAARTNLCVDYGRGVDGSSGIFLNLGEWF
jgi:hypothetical protein